jgi:hypothetical protein
MGASGREGGRWRWGMGAGGGVGAFGVEREQRSRHGSERLLVRGRRSLAVLARSLPSPRFILVLVARAAGPRRAQAALAGGRYLGCLRLLQFLR